MINVYIPGYREDDWPIIRNEDAFIQLFMAYKYGTPDVINPSYVWVENYKKTGKGNIPVGSNEAKDIILMSNVKLVLKQLNLIKKEINNHSCGDANDYFNEGFIGLNTALKNYNIGMGTKFSTYAVPWIRKRILEYYKKNNPRRCPEYINECYSKIKKIEELVEINTGIDVTPTFLEECVENKDGYISFNTLLPEVIRNSKAGKKCKKMPFECYKKTIEYFYGNSYVSLESKLKEDSTTRLEEILVDPDFEEKQRANDIKRAFEEVIQKGEEKFYDVYVCLCVENRTSQQEFADYFGISVSQGRTLRAKFEKFIIKNRKYFEPWLTPKED